MRRLLNLRIRLDAAQQCHHDLLNARERRRIAKRYNEESLPGES